MALRKDDSRSKEELTTQRFVSSGLALFASITVTTAAVDGISPLTVQSVQLQQPLMVECT